MPIISGGGSSGGGFVKLFDSTLSGAALSIDTGASGISGAYSHLFFEVYARCAGAVFTDGLNVNFNNDSGANYDFVRVQDNAGTVGNNAAFGQTAVAIGSIPGASGTASYFASISGRLPSYSAVTAGYKTGDTVGGVTYDAITHALTYATQFTWRSTAAISRMTISVGGGSNLLTGSRLSIYGLL